MTETSTQLLMIAAAWIAMVVSVARFTARSADGSVGLPMAFLFSMTFLYCGFVAYAVPGYSHMRAGGSLYLQSYGFSEETVLLGAMASVLGVAGFLVGCWLGNGRRRRGAGTGAAPRLVISGNHRKFLLWSLGLFGFAGFVVGVMNLPIPMIQAVLQVARNAAVVAVCLGATFVALVDRRSNYTLWLVLAGTIPTAYLIVWGFTSYGFIVFTCFASYWLAVLAPRSLGSLRIGLAGAAITYGILSLFVAWMSFRTELRAVLWSDAGAADRVGAIVDAFSKTELLQPGNFESLDWISTRLNQYVFVGKMIEWHELYPDLRLHGETLYLALLTWVPRFLWPGKPEMGGNTFVAENTGMRFSESATFGAGPVFEFYVNFGYVGVFLGFVVLGLLVRWIDRSAAHALRTGQFMDYARWFTVGLAFIAPLTDFFFLINTAVMSWLVMTMLGWLLRRQRYPMLQRTPVESLHRQVMRPQR